MKRHFKIIVASTLLLITFTTSKAQEETSVTPEKEKCAWVSDKGYWTVESNIKTPKHAIVYFYNNSSQLVYKEVIEGIKINLHRESVKIKLTKAMEEAVWAWNFEKPKKEDEQIVASLFK
ncbi:hypothetical protein ACI6Q2_08430 [Chitinophagaceae bacterium LWZ2-11]